MNTDKVTTAGFGILGLDQLGEGALKLIVAVPIGDIAGIVHGVTQVLAGLGALIGGYFTNKAS